MAIIKKCQFGTVVFFFTIMIVRLVYYILIKTHQSVKKETEIVFCRLLYTILSSFHEHDARRLKENQKLNPFDVKIHFKMFFYILT